MLQNRIYIVLLCLALTPWHFATSKDPASEIKSHHSWADGVTLSAHFGFSGIWKLGHTCPVRIDIDGLDGLPLGALSIELQTLDGDGVTVTYNRTLDATEFSTSTSGTRSAWLPIRIGRQQASVTIRIRMQGSLLAEKRLEAGDFPAALPSTQPLIVAIGSTQGVETASSSNVAGTATTFTTSQIQAINNLPDTWQSYSACDLLILSSNDLALLQAIRPNQWQAIDRWIRDGGACFISLGPNSRALASIKEFAELLPGRIQEFGKVTNPGPLESHVGTQDPIDFFEVTGLEPGTAEVELTLQDSLNRRLPWLLRHAHGFGSIQIVASDLEQAAFAEWEDRNQLWRMLLGRFIDLGVAEKSLQMQVGGSSYLGYDDLVGQLRGTLDVFPSVAVVSFGQAVAVIIVLLLLIGPLDYFISVTWLKRPHISWYFAGAMLTTVSLGLIALHAKLRPDKVRVNTLQILDIDTASQQTTGHLWSHVYSARARKLDVAVQLNAPGSASQATSIDWQGLPGRGLGGLLSQLNTDMGMPSYSIEQFASGQTAFEQVGVPAAGTKCLAAVWHQQLELQSHTQLQEIPGIDQLEGSVVNPLNVDLKDCMLLYHHWYYSMPSRILPGQEIKVSFETIPKDLPRRLNGRRVIQGSEQITPWNPADRNSVGRLLEMLMFYKAASGPNYTTLLHRYQPQLDFSNLLMLNRAILVGRIDAPLASVIVTGEDTMPTAEQDLNQAWVRLVFPVAQNHSK